jgi:NAD(P)H-hydrate epimerase
MKPISIKQVFEKLPDKNLNSLIHKEIETDYYSIENHDIASLIPVREPFAHKGNFGHALLVAGSRGKTGAAVLGAKACMRSGAGLLTVHIPACGELILQTAIPEAMVDMDYEQDFITNLNSIAKYNAIGIGPGIGCNDKTAETLLWLFENIKQPLVLDADAINLIAQNRQLQKKLPANSILTPHVGEFDRLAGASENAPERLQKACRWAVEFKSYLILKGANTAICTPNKECYFNSTGNPGMATAGSGDVLTGIILGLLAQAYSPLNASLTGVFLHGLAGDIAANEKSQESLIASDIIENLSLAFKKINTFVVIKSE